MVASSHQRPEAPEFPYWPFTCLSLYTRMARDFGGCAEAVARSNDAMDAMRAETDFGVKLYADLMKGWCDLALAPWTAMAGAMVEQMQDAVPPGPVASPRPRTPRGTH